MEFFGEFIKLRDFFYVILFTTILGYEIISHVSIVLLSPMNSAINSIHGLIVIGGIIVVGNAREDEVTVLILGFISIILGVMNLVGSTLYTDRILKYIKNKNSSEE